MNVVEIASWLNPEGVSAAPCGWLSAISIFVDERYENYDYDLIGPRARRRISQVLLTTWRREGPRLPEARQSDLVELVREQPANLDKVRDWLRRTESATDFQRCRPELEATQEDGIELRRRGMFQSRLPRPG